MLKMIIIEDEKLEREGLIKFLDWNSFGVEIVGVACDGIDGMELAETTKPDIIITDIKMPGMNGLDMSKKIKEILPQTKIIILTGYGDFTFAKQAIGLSVSDYILKPIEEEELISAVEKIVHECKKTKDVELILNKEYENQKVQFCMDLLQGKIGEEIIEGIGADYGFIATEKATFSILGFKFKDIDIELLQTLNWQIGNEVSNNILFSVHNEKENTIFACVRIDEKSIIDIHDVCQSIVEYINSRELTCFMGIGTSVESIYDIKESTQTAHNALDYGMFWYDSGMFYFKDIINTKSNKEQISRFIELGNKYSKQLVYAVGCSNEDVIRSLLNEIFEFVKGNKNIDRKYIYNFLYNVICEVSLTLYSIEKNNQNSSSEENDFGKPLLELNNLKLISEYIVEFFETVIGAINKKRYNKDENIIKNVIKITEENYMTGICLKTIAAQVYLSPNYLGQIFKKYTGKSYNDYLCELRMKKAKELLMDANRKISAVGKEVGITNNSYFCILFKEFYGMAPKEFQEMMVRN